MLARAIELSEEAVVERRLEATETARALFENSSRVLLDDPSEVVAPAADTEARRTLQLPVEMTVQLGAGSSAVQTVVLELGPPTRSPDAMVFALTWRPAGHTHLLPAFRGALEVAPEGLHTRLSLHGTYRPPLGPVGAFGDGLIGHRVARRTISAFLRTVAQRIDEEVDRRMAGGVRPATHPPDPSATVAPESWLG